MSTNEGSSQGVATPKQPVQPAPQTTHPIGDRSDGGSPEIQRALKELKMSLSSSARIIRAGADRALYGRDIADPPGMLSRSFKFVPDAVITPATPDDVSAVLKTAVAHGIPVTPRGVASSGFGGAVPTRGGLVLDLSPMAEQSTPNRREGTISLRPGARWAEVMNSLDTIGMAPFTYPSSGFSTVAGWVATGGFGLHGWGYGHFSEHVAGLEVVFAGEAPRWVKPDHPEFPLLFGSEGQLGIITGVKLKLRERPSAVLPRAFTFPSPEAAEIFIRDISKAELKPATMKLLDRGFMAEQARFRENMHPGRSHIFPEREVVVLCFDDRIEADRFNDKVSGFIEASNGEEASHGLATFLWEDRLLPLKGRRLAPSLLAAMVLLPLDRTATFIERARTLSSRFGVHLAVDGHAVKTIDGPRMLILATYPSDSRRPIRYLLQSGLAALLTKLGISLGGNAYSAGLWNSPFLESKAGSKAKLKKLLAMKRQVDPHGILNPGKLTSAGGLSGFALRRLPFAMAMGGLKLLSLFMRLRPEPESYPSWPSSDLLLASAEQCSRCGNCVSCCPAYLVTGLEAVSPRAKLQVARKFLAGETIDPGTIESTFMCLHCGACEEVCQSFLPLVDSWDKLEEKLAETYGFPTEAVGTFIDDVDSNPAYRSMVHPNHSARILPTLKPKPWRKPTS